MRALLVVAAFATILLASVGSATPGVLKTRTLATAGTVLGIAADGDRATVDVGLPGRCARVLVWEPLRRPQVVTLLHRGRCEGIRKDVHAPALAGTRAAWYWRTGGNTLETIVLTATLAHQTPVRIAEGVFGDMDGSGGEFVRPPVGDGGLLAFTYELRCGPDSREFPCPPGRGSGDVLYASVWRADGRSPCPGMTHAGRSLRACTRVAEADGELSVLAVDAGRIAVRTASGVRLLTGNGGLLRQFAVRARAAALSGNRLALRTSDAVEVYDTGSGRQTARFPAARSLRLQDLDRGILVTASGRMVTLRRLGRGRTSTIQAAGTAWAQLERPGLFVAGGRRVAFTPIGDVLRRLGG
jgi:hypothetical protein